MGRRATAATSGTTTHPSFPEALRFWLKLGFINFGGPTGQIAIMQRELVERRRWISQERFLHALSYCMLLPGPEAQQLAIYIGWLLHRTLGGVVAGTLFVLPSLFLLLGLTWLYAAYGHVPAIAGVLYGLKPVVLAVVVYAVLRIGRKALRTPFMIGIAAASFLALNFLQATFPAVIAAAALLGFVGWRLVPRLFRPGGSDPHAGGGGADHAVLADRHAPPVHTRPNRRRSVILVVGGACCWLLPLAVLARWPGPGQVFLNEGLFFSKAALVTFGGAYAVLSYIAQESVHQFGWLSSSQMVDGLGLAETTPGPLIMVVTFVGFMGGWTFHGPMPPAVAGVIAGLVATYFTFLPSFLFIFLGAPYIERLRGNQALSAALAAITAAVVGVILNLAVFFAQSVLFLPGGEVAVFPLALAILAFLVLLTTAVDILPVILAGGLVGLVYTLWIGR